MPVGVPAMYSQQLPQAMAMWGPYLALYQMQQAMMGGGVYPPLPARAASDHYAQQTAHAHQAIMLAMRQMPAVTGPGAVPRSLGIAIGTGTGQAQLSPQLVPALSVTSLSQGTCWPRLIP